MVNKMYHIIQRSVINEEVLIEDNRNGDDYVVSQDADRNNELMPYDIPRGEDNEKVMVEVSNYHHLEYKSQVNKIRKSKKDKKDLP